MAAAPPPPPTSKGAAAAVPPAPPTPPPPAPAKAQAQQPRRVLSVQSSVVRGYVGNKCAVLPLQLHGLDVDPLHSVQLSNHTGYPRVSGHRFSAEHAEGVFAALEDNGLLFFEEMGGGGGGGSGAADGRRSGARLPAYSHLLTGYVGTAGFLRAVVGAAQRLGCGGGGADADDGGSAAATVPPSSPPPPPPPAVEWYCDPVMGDGGRLYVPQELVSVYRDEVVPLAAVLLPNGFELGLLDGCGGGDGDGRGGGGGGGGQSEESQKREAGEGDGAASAPPAAASEARALAAAARLLRRGPHTVVVTSLPSSEEEQQLRDGGDDDDDDSAITLLAVTRRPQDRPCELTPESGAAAASDAKNPQKNPQTIRAWRLRVPRVPGYYTGTGDLLSALFLAHSSRSPRDLPSALERSVSALQAVLRDTAQHAAAAELALFGGGGGEGGGAAAAGSDGQWEEDNEERDPAAVARRFRARELRLVQNLAALAAGGVFGQGAASGPGGADACSCHLRCEELPVPDV